MNVKWGWLTHLGILGIMVLAGCKTHQPDLKPAKEPEIFNPPSANTKNDYPKQAFNTDDPTKRFGLDPGVVPARGMSMNQGMGPGVNPGGSFGGPRP